ncbi:oxidation resistance protein [Stylonychia lemnae]|uniref:Oxidation resistance protein n=1 Tax=Stylonychia lemnae TaxID=5949 RepID=A0A078AWF6_STYLE|nr:oxidation resistance protein [Stylonychia lemnae]|eukprot:CDW85582.1 oxidation resistance protein [Stylonychia lemnae]
MDEQSKLSLKEQITQDLGWIVIPQSEALLKNKTQRINSEDDKTLLTNIKYYKVQKGDTLFKIAYIFGISQRMIKELNNLYSEDVFPEQILKIIDNNSGNSHLLSDNENGELQRATACFGGSDQQKYNTNDRSIQNQSYQNNNESSYFGEDSLTNADLFNNLDSIDRLSLRSQSMRTQMSPVMTFDDISSQFQRLQMGYKEMQESFKQYSQKGNQTDAYYCTKNGKVKGIMTLTEHLVMFNPIKCAENEQFTKDLQQYQAIIDLQDIVSAQQIRNENESCKFIEDPEIKKNYKYDYYIQLNLSTVNGNSLKQLISRGGQNGKKGLANEENKDNDGFGSVMDENNHLLKCFHLKSIKSIASVYFRFSHRDLKGKALSNKTQKTIVEEIYDKMLAYIDYQKSCKREVSSTYVKFYDQNVDSNQQSFLNFHSNKDSQQQKLVDQYQYASKGPLTKNSLLISVCLPEFNIMVKDQSEIITNENRKLITFFLPGLIRMREWKLLYTISVDGVSMQTFFRRVKSRDNTVIIIKDLNDSIFGAYCCEEWKKHQGYFGLGESFVFKFIDEQEDIKVFGYTQENDKIQFCDDNCLMIGGGKRDGRSSESETFNNEVLSAERDFYVKAFEVWGFDFI